MNSIQSIKNEQIQLLTKLLSNKNKHRRMYQCTVLEGIHLIRAYIHNGFIPKRVYLPESKKQQNEINQLLNFIQQDICWWVTPNILNNITSLSEAEDVMALIEIPQPKTLPKHGDCIVLESIQDPGNMGTILRSAVAAGIKTVLLGEGCVDVYSPKVLRSGMGAHFELEIHECVNLQDWCQQYQERILATALTEKSCSLYDLDLIKPSAWIFGNEGQGVSKNLLAQADMGVKIPMMANIESLNVAMATTVCLFEQMRQRLLAG